MIWKSCDIYCGFWEIGKQLPLKVLKNAHILELTLKNYQNKVSLLTNLLVHIFIKFNDHNPISNEILITSLLLIS